jgi:hypothetical protein
MNHTSDYQSSFYKASSQAYEWAVNVAAGEVKLDLVQYAKIIHDKAMNGDTNYPFIEEFVKYSTDGDVGRFVIPHQALFNYGITLTKKSSRVLDRLKVCGLKENTDWICETLKNTRGNKVHTYYLTPYAFTTLLSRARIYKKHPVPDGYYPAYFQFIAYVILPTYEVYRTTYNKLYLYESSEREPEDRSQDTGLKINYEVEIQKRDKEIADMKLEYEAKIADLQHLIADLKKAIHTLSA